MQVLIDKLKMPWSFMRALRLILGVLLMLQGLLAQQWFASFIGFVFAIMPILNLGCGCAESSCALSKSKQKL